MLRAPKWTEFPRYPVITGTAVLAVGLTVAWWAKVDISPLFDNAEIRRGQLWRLVTCIFPHLDILHLAFNIYWLWVFGPIVEQVYGHARTAALLLLFAFGSNALDFALAQGGVGLSGVGYGLFGLLWILSQNDERFQGAVDYKTARLFIVWFFFCILTTMTNTFRVANVAHGVGVILGVLVGVAIVRPSYRRLATAGVALILVFGLWAATFGRPLVNLSRYTGYEEGKWGYDALMADHNQEAARWLRDATIYRPSVPEYWFDLGIAYQRLGNVSAAMQAYKRAQQLDPDNPKYSQSSDKND
jgi:membrane associated rhomboid family serine protease